MTNVVLIGLKGHQGTCLEVIAKREDVRLAAATDDDASALQGLRRSPAVDAQTLLTPNLDEVLALRDVQVAILAEDNLSRAEHLVACAGRGWHVVAEKPLATDLDSLVTVRQAVEQAGIRLSMLLTMRFEGQYAAMRDQVTAGAVGTPLLLSAQKSYRRGNRPRWQQEHRTFGGTIPFIGIHLLDLLHFVTGCDYRRVTALQHNAGLPGSGTIEETATLLLETTGGALVDLRLDYLRPAKAPTHGDDRLRVAGSEGVIEALGGRVSLLTGDQAPREVPPVAAGSLFGSFLDELAGQGSHPIAAAECFRITEVSLKARQAAETGQWVAL